MIVRCVKEGREFKPRRCRRCASARGRAESAQAGRQWGVWYSLGPELPTMNMSM
jgi:hypothetical protein